MKQEIPRPIAIAIVAIVAIVGIGFLLFKINPPPAGSPKEIGGGTPVTAGPGGLAPIGEDGKPIDESKSGGR